MFTFLTSFAVSPLFEDEEKSRIAGLLHIILLAIMVAGIVYAIVWLIIAPDQIERLGMIALAYPIALTSFFLMRRGQVQGASILLSSAMWLLMTFGAITSGGVQSPSFNSYIVTILGAGLLLGWQIGLGFALLSMLSGLLMLYAESHQLLPPLAVSHTPLSTWASETVFFLMTVVLLHLATRSINDSLQRAQQNERVLAQRNQELEENRDLLSKEIAERKQVQEVLRQHHEQLEELVKERTAQLTQVNQQLQEEIKLHQQTESALRESEGQLKRYTNELKMANQDISQYAYVVSHDLRAPLRAIHNYADFLLEDLIDSLEEEQELYLMGLRRAVQEAEQLVEDLLHLSRIGRQAVRLEAIELGHFFKQLLTTLQLPSEVELIMPNDWPTIQSEPTLLRQIMQNLILNGIKFNHTLPKRIELGWQSSADEIELFVRDNGIGIEPRYQAQIFQVFQRLHTSAEYKGTGIGLAIVKKAANKLGGSVRLDSAPREGSTFFVRLPTALTPNPSPNLGRGGTFTN